MAEPIAILNLGRKNYRQTYKIQKELVEKRLRGQIPDTLVLVEHLPVFTVGKNGSKKNILVPLEKIKRERIEIIEVDRGGDITYHGPGQIVGYSIIDLKNYGKDIHLYLRMLEEVLIRLLKEFGIKAKRESGVTGVWVNDKKIASIGIGISKWVTYHGFALNVEPNMEHFRMINSCGLGKGVTSIKEQLGKRCPPKKQIEEKLAETFIEFFKKEE